MERKQTCIIEEGFEGLPSVPLAEAGDHDVRHGGVPGLGEGELTACSGDHRPTRYLVCNCTDGVFAHPEPMSLADAKEFVRQFPARYFRQGYYLTADGRRIRPEHVKLEIVDENLNCMSWDEPDYGQALRGD